MSCEYPEGVLKRLQDVELEILEVVAQVCEKLKVTWFLDSGTCLGALRHKGFIPWDDDVDVGLPLDDYRIFCEQAPSLLPEGYGLYTHATTENYPPLFAKIYKKGTRFMGDQMVEAGFEEGIFVDVFAFVQLDSDEKKAARQMRRATFWQRVSYLYYSAHPHIPRGVPLRVLVQGVCVVAHHLIRTFLSPQAIERHFERCFDEGNKEGLWCDIFYTDYGTFASETLFPPVLHDFEGRQFPVPRNAPVYLTTMYGDYMTLPPVEQRSVYVPLILDFGDGVNVMECAAQTPKG